MSRFARATAVAVTALAVGLASPGAAVADELTDLLEGVWSSTYTADRFVVSVWDGQTSVSKAFVEHADGVEMVRVDSSWTLIGGGRAMAIDETPAGIVFRSESVPIQSSRYTVEETDAARHMGRDCTLMSVLEGDVLRATFLVDGYTGAPLIVETYLPDGSMFRRVSLQNFKPYRTYDAPSTDPGSYEVLVPVRDDRLPGSVAGYDLVDTFEAPGQGIQGFYRDGLFSFSLFVLPHGTQVTGMDSASAYSVGDDVYEVAPTAHDVRIHWTASGGEMVLVGDLPPDHADEVLAELPQPYGRGFFERLWHRLFG